MFVFFSWRSAREDSLNRQVQLPDFLRGRPSTIRASLAEQAQLGEACSSQVTPYFGRLKLQPYLDAHVLSQTRKREDLFCSLTLSFPLLAGAGNAENVFLVPKSDKSRLFDYEEGIFPAAFFLSFNAYKPWAPSHIVDLCRGTCTCRHYVLSHMPCKHMFAVLNCTSKAWTDLPSSLLDHPWLNSVVKDSRCCLR